MAIKILERIYNEIYTDGETDWLLGNVGEWQKLKIKCEVGIDYLATQQSPIQIDYINNAFILASGESWGEYGFDNGMTIVLAFKLSTDTNGDGEFDTFTNFQKSYSISNVYQSTMEVVETIEVDGFDSIPVNFGSKKVTDVLFYCSNIPEGCRIVYGQITNVDYESNQLNSFIDGSETEFSFPGLNALSIDEWGLMDPVGTQSGMSIRLARVRRVDNPGGIYKRHYEFEFQYMISSLFEDLSTFENMEMPSYLSGEGSLTDNFKINFFPEWNNPNIYIENDMTQTRRLGNTGWFEENFNDLNNKFKVDSIQYFDENGNVVDGLDYASTTKVKAVISGVKNLNAQTECGFGFAWIPTDEDDYKNKKTPFYQNCFIQSGSLDDGFLLDQLYIDNYYGGGVGGASMDTTKIRFSNVNNKIIFESNFVPNTAFFNAFEQKGETDRNFILWISVADGSLERNFSDRVALLADFGQMIKTIPPAGNYDNIDNAFIEHPFDQTNIGEISLQAIIQDDILCRMPFRVPTDGSILFERMVFGVEAINLGTGESFDLEKIEIDLSQFPTTSDGVQQLSVDTIRGFKLEPGNNKNWVKIARETPMDTSTHAGFIAYFATKLRWEDWIRNQNTPNAFFDSSELNEGFHNDWIHYLRTTGWSIKYFTEIISNELGELYEYKNQWNMTFNDYDENENISVSHQYFRDSDNTLLNVGNDVETGRPLGVILSNEPTRIEIEFEILGSETWDIATTYGVVTLEIDRGAGRFEQRQLSSVWGSESDNPLKPLTNETKLKTEVDGTFKFFKLSCLVDPDLLQDAEKYRITGRVGCQDDDGTEFTSGLYETRYAENYE